jgi:hypothetical protein
MTSYLTEIICLLCLQGPLLFLLSLPLPTQTHIFIYPVVAVPRCVGGKGKVSPLMEQQLGEELKGTKY